LRHFFALEDIRETLRQRLPNITSPEEENTIKERVNRVKKILDDIENDTGTPEVRKIANNIDIRSREETNINIQPIQAAGRLTPEARKALIAYGDGYSTCDACRKPFRLDKISSPPIAPFHEQLASFVNMDVARVVPGARRGFQAVASTLVNKGDSVIVSALAHYTEFLAV
jgi:Sep-tRNA:Cys-tRNA synthetase